MGSQGGGGFCSHHLWSGRGSRTCFLVTRQEGGIRQTQKVLETQSACVSLIPKGNFSEKVGGGGVELKEEFPLLQVWAVTKEQHQVTMTAFLGRRLT